MPQEKRANKTASLQYERQYLASGCNKIMGFDEAGRGTWAGPVVAAGVCLPLERKDLSKVLKGVRDSKQMTPRQRTTLAERIKEIALAWGVGSASSDDHAAAASSKKRARRDRRANDDSASARSSAPSPPAGSGTLGAL